MRAKLAAPASLATAVGVFAVLFLMTHSLLWSPLLAALAALGLYLMLDDRTPAQVRDGEYAEDANRKVEEALRTVRQIRGITAQVLSPSVKHSLQQACEYVPELLTRVRKTSPNNLYSSASSLGGHLTSLAGVVEQYLDIQRKPDFYKNPAELMRGGEIAIQRFTEFTVDSLRLVNSGELAQYQANLETVAPPQLPDLGAEK
ncbi:hypothetical protein Rhe02_42410 [Rhizocola hellebori]|uniref:5-bromo-4-chloroindolyl phosphate hydrolysis protein n=1 Tax=Rhizocola hellebori TaxID=1392758 RepID=A0A8J3VGB3_9ACTN|nr:5-bromo-4-chloroindolyl phosphate hydrolysis family protein [Rhizocola hellebori]GIH06174.1 hypothetical protein Rhe02_42410 [Rhizocola hellebori]